MSKRGWKPKVIKDLEGSNYKKKDRNKEPKPRPKVGRRPLTLDDRGKRIWDKLKPKLERHGLLTELDGPVFMSLCQAISRYQVIQKEMKRDDFKLMYVEEIMDQMGNERLNLKANPLLAQERQYLQAIRILAKEFGMTPAGRIGLKVENDEGEGEDLLS